MNADRLLALFEEISEAPDAIPRLRRFILDLAVRGKLGEPPRSWLECSLGDLGDWGSGGTPLKTRPEYYGGDIPWLVIGDLNDGLVTSSATSITEEGLANSSAKIVDEGTLLIAMYGSIGKLGIAGMRCATNQAIAFCRPYSDMVTRDYLFVLLKSLRNELIMQGQGVAQQNISQKILKAHLVELPPLAEQLQIVAKVDELMALCDQLEAARQQREQCRERLVGASLERFNQPSEDPDAFRSDARFALEVLPSITTTPAQIKQLRQTILNLAVRGKLVEQDPEDEPADVRLVQIQRALSSTIASMGLRLKRSSSSPATSPEGDFAGVPSSWGLSTLGSLAIVLDPNPSHRYPSYDGGTVPILSTQEFSGLDGWNPSTAKLVPHSFFEYQQANCRFEQGDIVFARKGRLGLPRFLPDFEQFTFSHTVFLVKPMPGIFPEYLLWLLRRGQVITWLTNEMNANTGVPTLGKEKMERLPIPLPPLAEQHRIVAKVDELMALCDQLEQQLSQAEQSRYGLLEAVLQEALAEPQPVLQSLARA
jgi:type I restriction enzyme S subunit